MDRYHEILDLVLNTRLFIESFWKSIENKIINTGYIQIDIYFKHYSATERSKLLSNLKYKKLEVILQKSQTDEDEFINSLKKIHELLLDEETISKITLDTAMSIISWLFYSNKQRYFAVLRKELANLVVSNKNNVAFINEKYLIRKDIDYQIINDLSTYINKILELSPNNHIFFRGQESLNYWIQPSISRSSTLYKNEARLYQELILRCPNDFINCKSHLDYLVEMQHYGLPTRLIDITFNPLVALYFATLEKANSISGEVILFDVSDDFFKYERSDTVSILSCLPLFSYEEQCILLSDSYIGDKRKFNRKENVLRLLHEIKMDKPAFSNRINPKDLRKNLIVTPVLKNNRIMKQSGAFIICGLADYTNNKEYPLETLRYRSKKGQFLFIIENKKSIQNELKAFNIHSATLFPEIDDVAYYLKNNWL